jgi:TonB family protein
VAHVAVQGSRLNQSSPLVLGGGTWSPAVTLGLVLTNIEELRDSLYDCRFFKVAVVRPHWKMRTMPLMCVYKRTVQSILCTGLALAGSLLARAQELAPANLEELSKRTEAAPTPRAEQPRAKPSLEIPAATPSEKPAPIVEQTPAAAVEEKASRAKRRAIVQPKVPPATPTSLSAAKAVAVSTPLPNYPYEARRAHTAGSGICVMSVDTTNGRVTSAIMAQSTGSEILDKITTDTFGQWRFRPGTVSQVQVPITYR